MRQIGEICPRPPPSFFCQRIAMDWTSAANPLRVPLDVAPRQKPHQSLPQQVAAHAEGWLATSANVDGGYGYTIGGASFTAPTAMAVLALRPGPVRGSSSSNF